ncbi:MAG TPA: hypothetical protein VHC22_28400 [Pirellulales bacterium]|nr:hypothetical protein [Pirellulales bacterium]
MLRNVPSVLRGITVAWGWGGAFLSFFVLAAPARAQNEVLNELYGSGVHAYNSGSYLEAYNDLTMAVRSGSQDPRVFYYRGLSYMRLGRPQEAQVDFKKGAALEMADTDRFYPVSKSLERIQGQARSQIERYRSSARLVAYQTRERKRFERYQRIRKNEPNVLMAPDDEAAEIPAPAKQPMKQPDAEPAPGDTEPEMPAEQPDAFAEDEAKTDEAKPDEEMPAEDMPAEKPAEDGDDAFSDDADKKPDEEMPAEKDDEDPFAEDDEKKPAEEMTEEGEGDKAADEMPADEKKPNDDDPFGNS